MLATPFASFAQPRKLWRIGFLWSVNVARKERSGLRGRIYTPPLFVPTSLRNAECLHVVNRWLTRNTLCSLRATLAALATPTSLPAAGYWRSANQWLTGNMPCYLGATVALKQNQKFGIRVAPEGSDGVRVSAKHRFNISRRTVSASNPYHTGSRTGDLAMLLKVGVFGYDCVATIQRESSDDFIRGTAQPCRLDVR